MKDIIRQLLFRITHHVAAVVAALAIVTSVAVGIVLADPLDPRKPPPGFVIAPNLTPIGTPFPRIGTPPPFQTPPIVPIPPITPPASLDDPRLRGTPILRIGSPPAAAPTGYPNYVRPDQALLDSIDALRTPATALCPASYPKRNLAQMRATICLPPSWVVDVDLADHTSILKKTGNPLPDAQVVFMYKSRPTTLVGCPEPARLQLASVQARVCAYGFGLGHGTQLMGVTLPPYGARASEVWVGVEIFSNDTVATAPLRREALAIVSGMTLER